MKRQREIGKERRVVRAERREARGWGTGGEGPGGEWVSRPLTR